MAKLIVLGTLVALFAAPLAHADGTFQIVPGVERPAATPPSADYMAQAIHDGRLSANRQLAGQRAENARLAGELRERQAEQRRRELLEILNRPVCGQYGCPRR